MTHIPPGFSTIDGELGIAGRKASDWVGQAGDTPLFVYDRELIRQRISTLRSLLPPNIAIHYAIKANPLPELLRWIAPLVDGFDVASGGELRRSLEVIDGRRISFAGPGKRDVDLQAAIAAEATLNIESAGELERAATIARLIGKPLHAALRINPPFEMKASGMRMGGGARPFGVDAQQAPDILQRMKQLGVAFEGFHIFAGSQNLSAAAVIEAQGRTIDLVADLAQFAPRPPALVNIGGGFGLPYFPGDTPLDIRAVGEALGERIAARPDSLSGTRFALELGRYLVGEAGVYLTRVVDRKVSQGETFLVVDGGLHHQLAASGNFGTVIRRNYPLANASRYDAVDVEQVNVVGCLCTPLDRLGEQVTLPVSQVGDLIAVFMAGAYGATASPSGFLGHGPAAEILA